MQTRTSLFSRPTAFLPLAMSLVALTTVLINIALFGVTHDADEGPAAHIFQLLIAGQIPIVAFFAIRWLRRTPARATPVLLTQVFAIFVALSPVFYFHL